MTATDTARSRFYRGDRMALSTARSASSVRYKATCKGTARKTGTSSIDCSRVLHLGRLRAVPLRSVTSKFGRTGDSELTERGTGERREEEGLPSLLNQTCSGNSAHHQRRQLVKNKLICHLISNNSASICRALNPHGLLSTANVCFSS